MKKIILILMAITAIAISCKKYEEGPCISFRSIESRLCHGRKMLTYTVDGVDSIGYLSNDQLIRVDILYDDVNLKNSFIVLGPLKNGYLNLASGWELQEKGKILQITGHNTSENTLGVFGCGLLPRWKILRLTKQELKMSTAIDGHIHEVFLKLMN
jgi:hypothetical protein